jgi:hypothetical protein
MSCIVRLLAWNVVRVWWSRIKVVLTFTSTICTRSCSVLVCQNGIHVEISPRFFIFKYPFPLEFQIWVGMRARFSVFLFSWMWPCLTLGHQGLIQAGKNPRFSSEEDVLSMSGDMSELCTWVVVGREVRGADGIGRRRGRG